MASIAVIIYHADSFKPELFINTVGKDILNAEIFFPDTIRSWIKNHTIFAKLKMYDTVILYTHNSSLAPDPRLAALAALYIGKKFYQLDAQQTYQELSITKIFSYAFAILKDYFRTPFFKKRIQQKLDILSKLIATKQAQHVKLDLSKPIVYLHPDIIINLMAGGSVGHIAGVLNNLHLIGSLPKFFTVDTVPTVDANICVKNILPPAGFFSMPIGMESFEFSSYFAEQVWNDIKNNLPSFVYQRNALNNYSGAELAIKKNIPFVLEYNGSEVWVAKHWGKPVRHESLAIQAEEISLNAANLVVVVSAPLKEELVARGFDAAKILVNPNGVNPKVYNPDIDGNPIRRLLHLENTCVLGFIGTFGKWHGAEKMAQAFVHLMKIRPHMQGKVKLLFIGEGIMRRETENILKQANVHDMAVFTGLIPQEKGPEYLAACDILVAPHVQNADGSKFFGSPTKLFEYMAMGKAIAASALDQMDDILEDNVTALKAKPSDIQDLASIFERLIEDENLRLRLGKAAREQVVEHYTWNKHTERIIAALKAHFDKSRTLHGKS